VAPATQHDVELSTPNAAKQAGARRQAAAGASINVKPLAFMCSTIIVSIDFT
jgi:hypothetical protein